MIAVRQEVNNLESSVAVQELEFAINLALYGLLGSLGNQYIVGNLPWKPSMYMKVKEGNEQGTGLSERNSFSKNRGGENELTIRYKY